MKQGSRNHSMMGYTLVEMLVVLAIMGMLTAAAMPVLLSARPGLAAKGAARAIARDLASARQEAIDRGVEERVVLSPAIGRYVTQPNGVQRVLPQGIAISFRGAAYNEIDFFPDGSSSGGAILVKSANAKHRVTARWPSGQIAVDE